MFYILLKISIIYFKMNYSNTLSLPDNSSIADFGYW